MKKQILILSILFAHTALASNYMVVMGAGGEEAKPNTIFDGAIQNLAKYVKNTPGLKVDLALNGGHPATERIIQNEFPANTGKSNFLESDYKHLIQKYSSMLENDEIKAGDQLMIYIDSHGAEKEDAYKTHRIATAEGTATNLNTLEGSSLVDLDQLEKIRDLARAKKVKLAIIDGSCHSGNSLKLADENTCVITSTGPNHYGFTSFSNNFAGAMAKGKNLEEIFLETRLKEYAPGFPMISTAAGLAVNDKLYESLTPFLYDYDEKNDKLTPYLLNNNSEAQMCLSNQNYKSLIETINKIEEMSTVTKKVLWLNVTDKQINFNQLRVLLSNYKAALDTVAVKMRELQVNRLKKEETIHVHAKTTGTGISYSTDYDYKVTWKDLISTNYDQMIESTNAKIRVESDLSNKTSLLGNLDFYSKAKAKKEEILRLNPDLTSVQDKQNELIRSLATTSNLADSIADEERKLYQTMYQLAQKDNQDKLSNPCHNFKL